MPMVLATTFSAFGSRGRSDTTYAVSQTAQTLPPLSHTVGSRNEFAIDFDISYNTFLASSGQDSIVQISTDYMTTMGYGAFVTQASTVPGSGTKYVTYAHLCFVGVSVNAYLYQGQYIGRSGNSGEVYDDNGNPPVDNCNPSYTAGMHLHFMFSISYPPSTSNVYQFGSEAESKVSNHKAAKTNNPGDLPYLHSTTSNNAGPGFTSSLVRAEAARRWTPS